MELKIQTIKAVVKKLNVDPETTSFDDLRRLVIEAFEWPTESKVTLVHQTRILSQSSEKLVSYSRLKDGDNIVVMKKTIAQAPKPTPPAGVTVSTEPVASNQTRPVESGATGVAQANSAEPGLSQAEVGVSSGVILPDPNNQGEGTTDTQFEAVIDSICGMGFDRERVRTALRAAFGNADRAVEYLTTNAIPQETITPPQTGLQTEAFGARPPQQGLLGQLGQLAASDPSVLPALLRTVGEQNPALLQMIEQNPALFSQILASMTGEGGESADAVDEQPGPGQESVTIELTRDEMASVERLCELGFERDVVLQVYIACEKNEQLAANFLFDMGPM